MFNILKRSITGFARFSLGYFVYTGLFWTAWITIYSIAVRGDMRFFDESTSHNSFLICSLMGLICSFMFELRKWLKRRG